MFGDMMRNAAAQELQQRQLQRAIDRPREIGRLARLDRISAVRLKDLEEKPLLAALKKPAAPEADFLDPRPEPVSRPGVGDDPAVLLVAIDPGVPRIHHRIIDDDRALASDRGPPSVLAREARNRRPGRPGEMSTNAGCNPRDRLRAAKAIPTCGSH